MPRNDSKSNFTLSTKMKSLKKYIPATILTAFGLLTLFLTTSIILDLFGVREKNVGYTPFVIWVNFFCGIAYLFAAYGFLKQKKETFKTLQFTVIALLITLIAFVVYINNGGIHKPDTFKALLFRITITSIFTFIAYFTINKKQFN